MMLMRIDKSLWSWTLVVHIDFWSVRWLVLVLTAGRTVLTVKQDEQPMQKSEVLDKTEGNLCILVSGMFRVP